MSTKQVNPITAACDLLSERPDSVRVVMRCLVDLLAQQRGLLAPEWPALETSAVDVDAVRAQLSGLEVSEWDHNDLGTAYEQLRRHKTESGDAVIYYTPVEIAEPMVQFSIGTTLKRLDDQSPEAVLRIVALDPACGAGTFLVCAARFLATEYARRLFGGATDLAVRLVMPTVLEMCIFGIDTDPVAIELAKAALWLEIRGAFPITFMDRHVVVADTLSGPDAQPPALAERFEVSS